MEFSSGVSLTMIGATGRYMIANRQSLAAFRDGDIDKIFLSYNSQEESSEGRITFEAGIKKITNDSGRISEEVFQNSIREVHWVETPGASNFYSVAPIKVSGSNKYMSIVVRSVNEEQLITDGEIADTIYSLPIHLESINGDLWRELPYTKSGDAELYLPGVTSSIAGWVFLNFGAYSYLLLPGASPLGIKERVLNYSEGGSKRITLLNAIDG